MYGWFDSSHFSWAGSDPSGKAVNSWSVSSEEALPGGTSSHLFLWAPMGGTHSPTGPLLEIYLVAIC